MGKKPVEKRNKGLQEPVRAILSRHENMFSELKGLITTNQTRTEVLLGDLQHKIELVADGVRNCAQ